MMRPFLPPKERDTIGNGKLIKPTTLSFAEEREKVSFNYHRPPEKLHLR
jgi:hypothetical protein